MRNAILGTGHYVPSKVVTNDDLAKIMPTSDEWIQQRVGVKKRHFVDFDNNPMSGVDMGVKAAAQALEMAKLKAEDIDLLIWGTLSPDHQFPGNAAWAQPKLGMRPGSAVMDIRNQCSFVPYAMTVADAMLKTGQFKHALIVGSEIHSTSLDFTERGRDVAVIFGDGAGAMVLGPATKEGQGIIATDVHADGSFAHELQVPFGSADGHDWLSQEKLTPERRFPRMNGKLVFKNAVTRMPESVAASLEKAKMIPADIDLFIAHQANLRIVEFIQKMLGLPDEKFYNNIQEYGNTTAASILIALDEAIRKGKLKEGQKCALAAFGAGFTWGSAIFQL